MRNYLYFTACILLLVCCEKSKFTTYDSGSYIQFSKSAEDSTSISFLFYPEAEELLIPLIVDISGFASDQDRAINLSVDAARTTAIKDKHFFMPDKMLMRAGNVSDTCWLKLKRTEDMKTQDFRIVLRIDGNEFFEQGQLDYLFSIIRVNDKISKPAWWDNNINWYFLGTYSDKKYSYFIDVTGAADMTGMPDGEKRSHCLKFKYWLESQKQAGNIIREDDEDKTEMTVPILG